MTDCTCQGHSKVYQCTVEGEGATIWKGTSFQCPATSNEIVLLHVQSTPSARGVGCSNGTLIGRIIGAEDGTYISQLAVAVRTELLGRSVSCVHDDLSGHANEIGSTILSVTTSKLNIHSGRQWHW